jgi:alpha-galactosidase
MGQVVTAEAKKPLKVFILAGQSNMQGHARVETLQGVAMDPKTKPMYDAMCDASGKPRVSKDVYISYLSETGGWGKTTPAEVSGPLTTGFGALGKEPKIGPELTFGLYMQKHLNEPVLLIKTAWGGKSLNTDFRPPSAGPYVWNDQAKELTEEKKQQKIKETGVYYRLMIDHVKKVLADPGKSHPAFDKSAGYELAGFVWFQGFNDYVDSGTYPNRNRPDGYQAYCDVFTHFIRDVRKELSAPKMPFVIGVLGVGGVTSPETEAAKPARYRGILPAFHAAMAKPATMPEFKDSVIAVETAPFWDVEIDRIEAKRSLAVGKAKQEAKEKKLDEKQAGALEKKYSEEALTAEEIDYLAKNRSNQGYHYYGSAKTLGGIGKALAEALAGRYGKNE